MAQEAEGDEYGLLELCVMTSDRAESGAISEKGGSLELIVIATDTEGTSDYATNLGFSVSWTTNDAGIATVDSQGTVTATGDGQVQITATSDDDDTIHDSITIAITGQSDSAYATSIEVLDESGKAIGDKGTVQLGAAGEFMQFFARVTWDDGTVTSTFDGSESGVTWKVGDSTIGYINPDSGRFKALSSGTVAVTATRAGGVGGSVVGRVYANIGFASENPEYNPSSSLIVRVIYEDYPETVVSEKTYSVAGFESLGAVRSAYTYINGETGTFATHSAYGVYLTTIIDDIKITPSDIRYFTFAANDGVNPGHITYSFLFGVPRYYFPDYSLGGSTGSAKAVYPMLALAEAVAQNDDTADYNDLNVGVRFRLEFGSAGKWDTESVSKSLKYINTMTVVLSGSPATGNGDGSGSGDGTGDGSGSGSDDGTGDGSASAGEAGDGATAITGGGVEVSGDVAEAADGATTTTGGGAEVSGEVADAGGSRRWSVYEMMSNSDGPALPDSTDNPLVPYAPAAVSLILCSGIASTTWGYRRQLA
ncbi:MAG: Ig-like domain-containing protein [Coriobacteriia bacterium]|nr:Ig-like domain-containing protein [Coriobacteriia bacterium]